MKPLNILLTAILSFPFVLAGSTDPFIGTWVYDSKKSPKPTIKYAIKDLGNNRFALTGSTGQTTEIKADGISIPLPAGGKVSFKKLDDHNWQMNRKDPVEMVRTYTVSADDKTLILNDVFTNAAGRHDKTVTTYARLSPGRSLFGEWQSVSMTEESGPRAEMMIEQYGSDGLSFIWPSSKDRLDINFDGKKYFGQGPAVEKGSSSTGQRINSRLIRTEDKSKDELDGTEEWAVSENGKTLTHTFRSAKSSVAFVSVFDKK